MNLEDHSAMESRFKTRNNRIANPKQLGSGLQIPNSKNLFVCDYIANGLRSAFETHCAKVRVTNANPRILPLLMLLFLFGLKSVAQVQVTVNVLPPYSAYLQDYPGRSNQVQIFVRNTTNAPLDVRFLGNITGDNGVVISTPVNFRPLAPLRLGPLENRLLSRNDLEGLFDLGQIEVQGIDKAQLYRGLPLPEGNYQLCVRAFDNRSSRPLSPEFPLGCSAPFMVRSVEPPIIINPVCDSKIVPNTPQNVIFSWTPPVGVSPAQVQYSLRVIELPDVQPVAPAPTPKVDVKKDNKATAPSPKDALEGKSLQNVASTLPVGYDPNVLIDAVVLPPSGVEVKNIKVNSFLYGPGQPPLKIGKRYAMRVQASDPTRKINFLNEGKSPVCYFTYGEEPTPKNDTPTVVEVAKESAKTLSINGFDMAGFRVAVSLTAKEVLKPINKKAKLYINNKTSVPVVLENVVVKSFQQNNKAEIKAISGKATTEEGATLKSFILPVSSELEGEARFDPQKLEVVADLQTDAPLDKQLDKTLPASTFEKAKVGPNQSAKVYGRIIWYSPIDAAKELLPASNTPLTVGMNQNDIAKQAQKNPVSTNTDALNKILNNNSTSDGLIENEFTPGPQKLTTKNEWFALEVHNEKLLLKGTAALAKDYQFKLAMPTDYELKLSGVLSLGVNDISQVTGELSGILMIPHLKSNALIPKSSSGSPSTTASKPNTNVGAGVGTKPISKNGIGTDATASKALDDPLLFSTVGLMIPFTNRTSLAFEAKIDETTITLNKDASVKLSFDYAVVSLGPVKPAQDLKINTPYGLSMPYAKVDFTAGDKSVYTFSIGSAYDNGVLWVKAEETSFSKKGLYEGFQAQFTKARLDVFEGKLFEAVVYGDVFVPFINQKCKLNLFADKNGFQYASVSKFAKQKFMLYGKTQTDKAEIEMYDAYFTKGSVVITGSSLDFYNAEDEDRNIYLKDMPMPPLYIWPDGKVSNLENNSNYTPLDNQVTGKYNGFKYKVTQTALFSDTNPKKYHFFVFGDFVLADNLAGVGGKPIQKYTHLSFVDNTNIVDPFPDGPKYNVPDKPIDKTPVNPTKKAGGPAWNDDDTDNGLFYTASDITAAEEPKVEFDLENKCVAVGGFESLPISFGQVCFQYYRDDATWGTGFGVSAKATLKQPASIGSVDARLMAGKRKQDNFTYWFAEFGVMKLNPAIDIFLDLEIYGFRGRVYYNMDHAPGSLSINDADYLPKKGGSLGLYALTPIRTKDRTLFWGDVATELSIGNKTLKIEGNGRFISATMDGENTRGSGKVTLDFDFKNKTMLGQATLTNLDLGAGCVNGGATIYLSPSNFVLAVGSPSNTLNLKAFCGTFGDLSPSVDMYMALYAVSNGEVQKIPSISWIPKGIGAVVYEKGTVFKLNTADYTDTDYGLTASAYQEATITATIAPKFQIFAEVGAILTASAFYGDYSFDLVKESLELQFMLPSPICVSIGKSICIGGIGGFVFTGKVSIPGGPSIFSGMCNGTYPDECNGLLNVFLKGLKKAGELLGDGVEAVGKALGVAAECVSNPIDCASDIGGEIADFFGF